MWWKLSYGGIIGHWLLWPVDVQHEVMNQTLNEKPKKFLQPAASFKEWGIIYLFLSEVVHQYF